MVYSRFLIFLKNLCDRALVAAFASIFIIDFQKYNCETYVILIIAVEEAVLHCPKSIMHRKRRGKLLQSLKKACVETSTYGTLLAVTEIGLGSILHSMHIPFSGTVLSLNQCFLLSRATALHRAPFVAASISNSAALLKSLSPAGKRFRPMLAISMQGLLYSLGICIFGSNFLGRCFGAVLLSFWSFIQSAFILWFIYGSLLSQLL